MEPSRILPGALTKRNIESAVTDLPHPVSPTKPRVSSSYISKETPSTAFTTPSSV